jgi:hypothetical protein
MDGIGCLAIVGMVLCGTIFLAPLGILIIAVSLVLMIVSFVRNKARTRAAGPCPRCDAHLVWLQAGDTCRCHRCGTALRIVGKGFELHGQ